MLITIIKDIGYLGEVVKWFWLAFWVIWIFFVVILCAEYVYRNFRLRLDPNFEPFTSKPSNIFIKLVYAIVITEIVIGIIAMVLTLVLLLLAVIICLPSI